MKLIVLIHFQRIEIGLACLVRVQPVAGRGDVLDIDQVFQLKEALLHDFILLGQGMLQSLYPSEAFCQLSSCDGEFTCLAVKRLNSWNWNTQRLDTDAGVGSPLLWSWLRSVSRLEIGRANSCDWISIQRFQFTSIHQLRPLQD